MRIAYKVFPRPDGESDYQAVISFRIARKHGPTSRYFEGLIDSGASDCLFHADIGRSIGLQIESGSKGQTYGVSGQATDVFYHDVVLYIGSNMLNIKAGFVERLPVAALLGRKGFFEHFKITFDPTTSPPGIVLERVLKT